jgi:hypothetical protein
MRNPVLALLCALWVFAPPANAQLLTNPVQDYINRTNLLNNILSNSRATDMSQSAQTGGKPSNGTPGVPQPGVSGRAADPTQFTSAGEFLLPKVLAQSSTSNPAQRQQAEQLFASLIQLYHQTARKDGFPSDDIAYALEYFVVNTYMTVHDLHDVEYEKDPRVRRGKDMFERLTIINQKKTLKVTIDQERAIYAQFKNHLAGIPAVQTMTDRQKQELTELLAITFGINYRTYMDGVNKIDDRIIDQARQVARTYLEKVTGTPIDRIQIRADGLRLQQPAP